MPCVNWFDIKMLDTAALLKVTFERWFHIFFSHGIYIYRYFLISEIPIEFAIFLYFGSKLFWIFSLTGVRSECELCFIF